MSQITFTEYGAAECIDGSKGILRAGNKKYLIDYGKDYKEKPRINPDQIVLPFDVTGISAALLTHSHGDHGGNELEFFLAGMRCDRYATYQTFEIQKKQLLQETQSTAAYNNKIKGKRFETGPNKGQFIPFKKNRFKYQDVKDTMSLYRGDGQFKGGFAYNTPIHIDDILTATFFEAGHIPGSAQILLDVNLNGKNTTVLTACDLGRTDYFIRDHPIADIPLVKPPEKNFPKPIDHIILEATYGAKVHRPLEYSIGLLYDTIMENAERKGALIIPAFSIMRTHLLSIILYDLEKSGKLPKNMQFYISSPGADEVSKIIMHHPEDMDQKTRKAFEDYDDNPFWFDRLIHHKKYEETQKVIDGNIKPYCIIGASGMCDMGRIVNILPHIISDPNNTIALLGYQAEGTRGHKMLKGEPFIEFYNTKVPLKAKVVNISGFSGHADCVESIEHLKQINSQYSGHQLKSINIKHGDKDNCYALAQKVLEAGFPSEIIRVLKKGQPVILD